MKIKRLEIVNFGKFSDFTIDFDCDFQMIFGNNEDGKSTVMAFILLMLYSDHGRSKSLEQKPRQLYLPWNGAAMEGAVEFSHSGVDYRLQKLFGATPGKDKINIIEISTSKEVKLPKGMEVGKYFLGLDLSAFNRTSFIRQLGSIETEKNDDIAEKLVNNLIKGEDSSSQQEVVIRLEDAKHKMISKSGSKGTLTEQRQHLDKLKEEQFAVRTQLKEQSETQTQYNQYKKQNDKLIALQEKINDYNQSKNTDKIKNLLAVATKLEQTQTNLLVNGLNDSNIDEYTSRLSYLQSQLEQIDTTLEAMGTDKVVAKITEAEMQSYNKLAEKLKKLVTVQESYLPVLVEAKTKLANNAEKEKYLRAETVKLQNDGKQLKAESEKYNNLQSKQDDLKAEYKNLGTQIEHKGEQLEREKDIFRREQEIKNASKAKKVFGVIAGLVCLIIFGISLYMGINKSDKIYFVVAAVSFVVMIFSLVLGLSKKGKSNYGKTNEVMANLEREIAGIKTNRDNISNKVEELVKEISGFNIDFYKLTANESDLSSKYQAINNLGIENNMLEGNIESQYALILSELKKVGLNYQEDLNIDVLIEDYHKQSQSFLLGKGFESGEKLNQAFALSQNDSENKQKLEQLKENKNNLEEEYLNLLKIYEPDVTVAAAKALSLQIALNCRDYIKLKEQADIMSNTIGLESYNVDYLNNVVSNTTQVSEPLTAEQVEIIEREIEELKSENLIQKMEELRLSLHPVSKQPEQIALEISELQKQVSEAEDYYDALSTALEVMQQADEEMRMSFSPMLNERAGDILGSMTAGKYDEVLVGKDYNILVKSGVHFRQWQYLSSGTIDQAYLALRLAIAEMVSDESSNLPLLLDDILVKYDDDRARLAVEFLKEYAKSQNTQIILFSCHHRMTSYANELGVQANNLR